MAMPISDASNLNTVLEWAMGRETTGGGYGSGDYLMPDGSVAWGAQIAVWNEPGTRTEWAARFDTGPRGYQHAQPYVTEDDAREAVAEVARLAPEQSPVLMSRTVTPWKQVPDA